MVVRCLYFGFLEKLGLFFVFTILFYTAIDLLLFLGVVLGLL